MYVAIQHNFLVIFAKHINPRWRSCPAWALQDPDRENKSLPPCTITMNYALRSLKKKHFSLPPPVETIERCCLSTKVDNRDEAVVIFQALRSFPNLQVLDLDFGEPGIAHLLSDDDLKELEIRRCISETFSRLRSLAVRGFLPLSCGGWNAFLASLDLTRLKALYADDHFIDMWHNSTLVNLEEFIGTYELAQENSLTSSQEFKDFLSHNKSLRTLKVGGLEECGDLSWVACLPRHLHTLHLVTSGNSRIEYQSSCAVKRNELAILAKALPRLTDLTIAVRATPRWPYDILEDIATTFPKLINLTLCLVSTSLGMRLPTLNTTSRAWRFYWQVLSNERRSASRPSGGIHHADLGPPIKSLTIAAPSPTASFCRRVLLDDERLLLACLVDEQEKASRGEADVCSKRVEDLVRAQSDGAAGAEMEYGNLVESIREVGNIRELIPEIYLRGRRSLSRWQLWIERRLAEFGISFHDVKFATAWPEELDEAFGRARSVVPKEGDGDANVLAAEDNSERCRLRQALGSEVFGRFEPEHIISPEKLVDYFKETEYSGHLL